MNRESKEEGIREGEAQAAREPETFASPMGQRQDTEGKDPAEGSLDREELIRRLEEKEKEAKENYDRWVRAVADLENYKKRAAKEKADLGKFANEQIIKELLPIVDNMERAIEHAHHENSLNVLLEGVRITAKQLLSVLEKYGVKRIDAMNEPFDPTYHEAMLELEGPGTGSNIVVKELEKGYLLNDRLIRPARVVVSKGPESNGPTKNTRHNR